jgi:hypothetical protein
MWKLKGETDKTENGAGKIRERRSEELHVMNGPLAESTPQRIYGESLLDAKQYLRKLHWQIMMSTMISQDYDMNKMNQYFSPLFFFFATI